MGEWGEVLLGEEREREKSGRNSGGVCLDVESREAFEELRRAILFSWLEFPRLPFPIPQSVSVLIFFSFFFFFFFYFSILLKFPHS